MINNFDKFPFDFSLPWTFYFFQILDRNKNWNNKNRCIKTYYINSAEYLEKKKEEMILLCDTMSARLYAHPARRDKSVIALELLAYVANRLVESNDCDKMWRAYESVCGRNKWIEKMWIVDVDTKDAFFVWDVIQKIESIEPYVKPYFINETVNWYHLIYNRWFNLSKFNLWIDVHKNNPTILYSP